MSAIIPAILPTSREDLDSKLLRLQGLVDEVQIDVVDGRFVTPASWPYSAPGGLVAEDKGELPYLGRLRFEIDLIVENPELLVGHWIEGGAARVTVHAETTHRLPQLIEEFQTKYGHDKDFAPGLLSLGLALNIATDTALIEPYLDRCDYVQFMGIARIGKQGEPFDTAVLPKIAAFHKKYPDMPIQVDGGVSVRTAPDLLRAGASRLIVGSDLWKAQNFEEELTALTELAQVYGLYA